MTDKQFKRTGQTIILDLQLQVAGA